MQLDKPVIRSALLALGIAAGGAFIGDGFVRARAADRFVTVKGISEREARADLAIWPLHLVATNNDLAQANIQMQNSVKVVRQFLARQNLDTTQAEMQGFAVADASTNQYGNSSDRGNRFVIRQTIVVRSTKPDLVLAASQRVAELVSSGVVLATGEEYRSRGPTFIFSGLNSLKPQMIAEATARAREGAEQFARDSHSPLGGIRTASQGVFSILPRDQAEGITEESQIVKTVRVVSTVEYFLRK
jgi:hypothetical protein